MTQYLFKAKTREGFIVKLLSEYMNSNVKYPPFHIDSTGIYLRATDQNREILIDIELPQENFTIYKCVRPLHFVVNSAHFYRLLKTIKKKDSIMMFINEQNPMKLGICVEQNDENSDKVNTYINITYMQPEEIELPDGYNKPIIITSKHFQKIKTLHNIGGEMKITVCSQIIKFFVNGKNLFSREISIGEEDDDVTQSDSFSQTFNTSHITQLTKCSGQTGNIQIYSHAELPIQIKMKVGTLGQLTVFIKSKELIDMLENDDDTKNIDDSLNNGGITYQKIIYEDDIKEDTETIQKNIQEIIRNNKQELPAQSQIQKDKNVSQHDTKEENTEQDDEEDLPPVIQINMRSKNTPAKNVKT